MMDIAYYLLYLPCLGFQWADETIYQTIRFILYTQLLVLTMPGKRTDENIVGKVRLWEKEDMLVTRKSFNPFRKQALVCVCSMRFLKTLWENQKLLITNNFSFSSSVFYPSGEFSSIFIKFEIVVCKLFQIGGI